MQQEASAKKGRVEMLQWLSQSPDLSWALIGPSERYVNGGKAQQKEETLKDKQTQSSGEQSERVADAPWREDRFYKYCSVIG